MTSNEVTETKRNSLKTRRDKKKGQAQLSPRERVLTTAIELFYRYGVHRVGIDRIIEESQVARMTFYKHFPSKSKLVAEFLKYKDKEWFDLLERSTSNSSLPAKERVLAIFDVLHEFFAAPEFYGCCFIRGLSEFRSPEDDPELARIVSEHFARTETFIEKLIQQCGVRNHRKAVQAISALISGAVVSAQVGSGTTIALINKELAKSVLSGEN